MLEFAFFCRFVTIQKNIFFFFVWLCQFSMEFGAIEVECRKTAAYFSPSLSIQSNEIKSHSVFSLLVLFVIFLWNFLLQSIRFLFCFSSKFFFWYSVFLFLDLYRAKKKMEFASSRKKKRVDNDDNTKRQPKMMMR